MSYPRGWWAPWRDLRWAFAAVWLIFLIYPFVAVATGSLASTQRAFGYVLIAAFAVVYVLACVYLMMGRGDHVALRYRLGAFAVLTAIGAGLIPVIGGEAFGVTPFLMAFAVFALPATYAVVTVITLIVAALLIGEWLPAHAVDPGTIVVMIAVGATMLGIRTLRAREMERDAAEERQHELNRQLSVVAERERVARDVHDILGHSLTVITVKSELAQRLIDIDPDRAKRELAELNSLSRHALDEVRATVGNLRSPDLATTLPAVRSALDAAGISASVPTASTADPAVDVLFAWVLREAVTNVVRHSAATECTITLGDNAIEIHDNGKGMNGQGAGRTAFGNGLRGLAERVEDAGGTFIVDSTLGGTTVRAVMR